MIELLNEALSTDCGLFIFHFHPGNSVKLSRDDWKSANELLPKFLLIAPARPHGSIVLGSDSADGLIAMPGQDQLTGRFTVRHFANRITDWPEVTATRTERLRFELQPLVRGRIIRALLEKTKIAVVGQSGGGTHVSLHLAQHGFAEIHGVDDDLVDDGNRFSGIGFNERHASKGEPKVTAVAKNLSYIAPGVRYRPIKARVPDQAAIDVLKQVDIIVGCVNNLHARADLQEIALRYAIPYVDIGLAMKTDQDSTKEFPPIQAIGGNIFTYIPGEACMWCTEFLTEDKLDRETDRRGRPYLQTKDGADAHVLSFNGVLASQAICDLINLLTGFGTSPYNTILRKYDGLKGTLVPWNVKRKHQCEKCSQYLCAGDPIWSPLKGQDPA